MTWKHVCLLSVFVAFTTPVIMLAMLKQNIPGYLIEQVSFNALRMYAIEQTQDLIKKTQKLQKEKKEFSHEIKKLVAVVKKFSKSSRKCLLSMHSGSNHIAHGIGGQ